MSTAGDMEDTQGMEMKRFYDINSIELSEYMSSIQTANNISERHVFALISEILWFNNVKHGHQANLFSAPSGWQFEDTHASSGTSLFPSLIVLQVDKCDAKPFLY